MQTSDHPSSTNQRLALVDTLRGFAILLMVIFHFCFDLSYYGLADFDFYSEPFWLHFRTIILSSFLLIMGISFALANADNFNRQQYLRRLGILIASALLISISTWLTFGDRFIFFGVLHFIAVASAVGLLFVHAGRFNLLAGVALIAFANLNQFAWFDQTGWRWIGLMTYKPGTEDYVPLLPWFGVVLIGMYLSPMVNHLAQKYLTTPQLPLGNTLALAGRHSLIIYLVHQPLLMGLLWIYTNALNTMAQSG